MTTELTYASIYGLLAMEGITSRQQNMGGGCAALVVDTADGGWIIIGNGEWNVGDSLSEAVYGGTVSVSTESADGIYSGDEDRFTECTTAHGVFAVVSALLNGGMMDCGTVGCEAGSHHVFDVAEDTRIGYDPMPTFTCPDYVAGE